MKFEPTRLADAVLIEPDRIADERGFFARIFDAEAFGIFQPESGAGHQDKRPDS
jgi:dTDP-4-dehydrorhamnose 3,5-epimerase-like enzyme